MKKPKFLKLIGFFAAVAGGSAVVILLWNWLAPVTLGLSVFNFWHAWICLLTFICCSTLLTVKSIEELDKYAAEISPVKNG